MPYCTMLKTNKKMVYQSNADAQTDPCLCCSPKLRSKNSDGEMREKKLYNTPDRRQTRTQQAIDEVSANLPSAALD